MIQAWSYREKPKRKQEPFHLQRDRYSVQFLKGKEAKDNILCVYEMETSEDCCTKRYGMHTIITQIYTGTDQ